MSKNDIIKVWAAIMCGEANYLPITKALISAFPQHEQTIRNLWEIQFSNEFDG